MKRVITKLLNGRASAVKVEMSAGSSRTLRACLSPFPPLRTPATQANQTQKGVENTTRSGVFLKNFELIESIFKHLLESS